MKPNIHGNSNGTRYEDIQYVDESTFGIIYRAIRVSDSKQVALKVFKNNNKTDIEREAYAAMSVRHENVIQIYEVDDFEDDDGQLKSFIAMEFAKQGNLDNVIISNANNGVIETAILEKLYNQILNGMKAIHDQGIIHRDIKTANILVSDEKLKVTDFGLSKNIDEVTRTQTYKGSGTWNYMAPESYLMGKMSLATDIYSLGVLFFVLATNQYPFSPATQDYESFRKLHVDILPPHVKSLNQEIPQHIDTLINRMLSKSPNTRPQSIQEIIDVLGRPAGSSSVKLLRISELARETLNAETLARHEAERRGVEHDEQISRNKVMNKQLIEQIQAHIQALNDDLQETYIHLSMGNEDHYTVIWGKEDLIRIQFNSQLFAGIAGRTFRGFKLLSGAIFTMPGFEHDEGYNLVLAANDDDIYGQWMGLDIKQSALIRSDGRRHQLAANTKVMDEMTMGGMTAIDGMLNDDAEDAITKIFEIALERRKSPKYDW